MSDTMNVEDVRSQAPTPHAGKTNFSAPLAVANVSNTNTPRGGGGTPRDSISPNRRASARESSRMSSQSYDELLNSMGGGTVTDHTADLDVEVMTRDVELLSNRLKSMDKCLLNPRGKLMQYW